MNLINLITGFFLVPALKIRIIPPMPRGKRTVFAMFCTESGNRLGTLRFHKQDKQGKGWKEHAEGLKKYCPRCMKQMAVKLKEEKHSK
ncbi:hypothetical protein KKF55_04340 [Patescibacteria group bacterium]|nr:hypothetical protein [Patescibacteria group bacterium]